MSSSVHILNATSLPLAELESVAQTIRQLLGLTVGLTQHRLELERAYDSSRAQYNSSALIAQVLSSINQSDENKRIAIVDVDLYIPVLTFVYGEAQLDGTAAVVSTYRLSNEFYGVEENRPLLLQRLTKELVHELGHTFGLYHCKQFECVMRASTYVEEIDLKKVEMCERCLKLLSEKIHCQ